MEKVMLLFPPELLGAVDAQAKRLGKKRSQVIREAAGEWLETQQQREFEAFLAAGYQEMAQQLAAIAEEVEPLQAVAAERVWRWDD